MAKLTRVTGKVFGGSAPLDEIGQFGSALAGTPTNTQDVGTIQALDAYSEGWGSAVVTSRQFPPIEEVTGVLKTISYQGCYLLQEGIPEYDINTEYSNTSVVKSINDGITTLYVSLANGNKGNALNNAAYWKPYVLDQIQRNIGEIVTSSIPLTDSGLHLLDGSLLVYGSYGGFIDYIADLYTSGTANDCFVSEADWQAAVSANGVCGKFVYDSVNNTVRLPKYSNKIYTKALENNAPVAGNGKGLGLTDGTNQYGFAYERVGSFGFSSLLSTTPNNSLPFVPTMYYGNTKFGLGVTTDGTESGIIADLANITTSLEGYYYIVIATSAKTDIQVDIDEIATDLNGKADVDLSNVSNTSGFRKLAEVYNNGSSWYKVYREYNPSTGDYIGLWCEQGGTISVVYRTVTDVALLKEFSDLNYNTFGNVQALEIEDYGSVGCSTKPYSTSVMQIYHNKYGKTRTCNWFASGYISQGE